MFCSAYGFFSSGQTLRCAHDRSQYARIMYRTSGFYITHKRKGRYPRTRTLSYDAMPRLSVKASRHSISTRLFIVG